MSVFTFSMQASRNKTALDSIEENNFQDITYSDDYLAVSIVPGLGVSNLIKEEIYQDESNGAQFARGFLKQGTPAIVDSDITNIYEMYKSENMWLAEDIAIDVDANVAQPMILLSLYSTKLEKYIPLYGYVYIKPEKEIAEISCSADNPNCLPDNYFLVTPIGPSHKEIDPLETIDTEKEVGVFEICKYGTDFSFIESIKIREAFEYKEDNVSITRTFSIDEKPIWESIIFEDEWFSSPTQPSAKVTNEHEITLEEDLLIENENCVTLKVNVGNVEGILFWNTALAGINSNIPSFVYNNHTNSYYKIGGQKEGIYYEEVPIPYQATGSIAVFTPTTGYSINFDSNEIVESTNYSFNLVPAVDLKIKTDQYKTAEIGNLNFSVNNTLNNDPGTLDAFLINRPKGTWEYEESPINNFVAITSGELSYVSEINIPTNGTFSIPIDESFSYGEYKHLQIFVDMPQGLTGEITFNLESVSPENINAEEVYIDTPPSFGPSIFNYYPLEDISDLPLSRKIILTNGEIDEIKINIYPQGNPAWPEWISNNGYTETPILNLDLYLKTENFDKTFEITPATVKVIGSFEEPVLLRIEQGSAFAPSSPESFNIVEVMPGDTIVLNDTEVIGHPVGKPNYFSRIYLEEYPNELGFISFEVNPIQSLDSPPIQSIVSVLNIEDYFYEDITFDNPVHSSLFSFGEEMLYQSSNSNSPIPKFLSIDAIKNEEVTMNETCFTAQGDIEIHGLTYNHDEHDLQPFDKVLLSMWNNTYYLPINAWTSFTAEFDTATDSPFFLSHGSNVCLHMKIQKPTEPLEGTFFNLTDIDAKIFGAEQSVPVLLQTGGELSETNQVKGTKTNFF